MPAYAAHISFDYGSAGALHATFVVIAPSHKKAVVAANVVAQDEARRIYRGAVGDPTVFMITKLEHGRLLEQHDIPPHTARVTP